MCDPNDPSSHDYGRGVAQIDGSTRWTCAICGDVVTLSRAMADQLRADGDRLRADAARTLAEKSAEARDRLHATLADLVPRTIASLAAYRAARQTTSLAEALARHMVDAWESEMEAARALADALEAEHVLDRLAAGYQTMQALQERLHRDWQHGGGFRVAPLAEKSGSSSGQTSDEFVDGLLRHSIIMQEGVIAEFTAKRLNCKALIAHVASAKAYLAWREGGMQGPPPEGYVAPE